MSHKHSQPPTSTCCYTTSSTASTELKLYQAFVFSVPIFLTFVLLLFFYLFYLRRRQVDWSSLLMRTTLDTNNDISRAEMGLKKEFRGMLPIIIYKESFFIKDTQCSVCLGEYQAEDKLQQIPSCGHSFHMDCIDHWLAIHSTCPLCRLSLLPPAKPSPEMPNTTAGESETGDGVQPNSEETQAVPEPNSSSNEAEDLQNSTDEEGRSSGSRSVDPMKECRDARNETDKEQPSCRFSGNA